MNKLKALNSRQWFVLVVVVPVLLASVYFGLVASDQFVSQSSFVIRSPAQRPAQVSTLANLIQTTGLSGGEEQSREVIEYLQSRSALADLQKRVDVHARFSTRAADWLSRFPAPWREDRFETLYQFYRHMVDAHLDRENGTAVLTVKAFNPADAQKINLALLDLSEDLVNRLNERAARKVVAEAENRVANAEARVRAARIALGAYRNRESLLDPNKQAAGVLDVSNKLVLEQASLQAQLEQAERVAPDNPGIPILKSRIAAISREIASQNGRAVGTSSGIASKLGSYEQLSLEQEFASQNLVAANAALEQSRNEALRQQYYLSRVVNPNLPDMALLPERLKSVLVLAASLICIYFIGWMLVTGIIEHAPEE